MLRVAVYPGSFDPPTFGHLDIIDRAARMVDKLIVCVGSNTAKTPFLSADERLECLRAICAKYGNIEIDAFDGLLVQYAIDKNATTIIRGLRATADFDYEFQIAMANRRLAPSIETVFLMTKWEHSFLSSSIVREVARFGGDYSEFVPPEVAQIVARNSART